MWGVYSLLLDTVYIFFNSFCLFIHRTLKNRDISVNEEHSVHESENVRFQKYWFVKKKKKTNSNASNSIVFCWDLSLKGMVHPRMKILSLITLPHVVPNPQDLRSSSERKLRCFWWNPRAFWPSIDSNAHNQGPERYQEHQQNSPWDISGSIIILWSHENTFCVQRKQN